MALGDLSKQIEVDARGEILDLKNTVNGMVIRCGGSLILVQLHLSEPDYGHWLRKLHESHWKSEVKVNWEGKRMYQMLKEYG